MPAEIVPNEGKNASLHGDHRPMALGFPGVLGSIEPRLWVSNKPRQPGFQTNPGHLGNPGFGFDRTQAAWVSNEPRAWVRSNPGRLGNPGSGFRTNPVPGSIKIPALGSIKTQALGSIKTQALGSIKTQALGSKEPRRGTQGKANEIPSDFAKKNDVQNSPLRRVIIATTVVHVSRPDEVENKRRDLPIVMMEQEIMEAINENPTVIDCEETGCGKTTQVPQRTEIVDYISQAFKKVMAIHKRLPLLPAGGILVFVTGQREVEYLCSKLREASRELIANTSKRDIGTEAATPSEMKSVGDIDMKDISEAFEIPANLTDQRQTKRFSSYEEDQCDLDEDETMGNGDSRVNALGDDGSLASLKAAFEALARRDVLKSNSKGKETVTNSVDDKSEQSNSCIKKKREDDKAVNPGALRVVPLYAMLPAVAQLRVFDEVKEGERLLVAVTNVVETSLTIPRVKYVVDTENEKVKNYNPTNGMETHEGKANEIPSDFAKKNDVQNSPLRRVIIATTVVHVSRPDEVENKRRDLPIVMMEQEIMEAINENPTVIDCEETGCGKTTQVPQNLYEKQQRMVLSGKTVNLEITIHFSKRTEIVDYISQAFKKVMAIHKRLPAGGILVFATGQREVEYLCSKLREASRELIANTSKRDIGTEAATPSEMKSVGNIDMKDISEAFEIPANLTDQRQTKRFSSYEEDQCDLDEDETMGNGDSRVNALGDDGSLASLKAACEALARRDVLKSNSKGKETVTNSVDDKSEQSNSCIKKKREDDKAVNPGALRVVPLYAMLPAVAQLRVFDEVKEGERLLVAATNVVKTSLTIPRVKYVVDTEKEKVKNYKPTNGMETHEVQWIIFSNILPDFSCAEISKIPIDGVILLMKSMVIEKVGNFPFPTAPEATALVEADRCLKALEALDGNGGLTSLGKAMAHYPMSPRNSRMLLSRIIT
ncbi:hypothetical protein SLEP1_g36538 [Rubroshorea leprosula]|uniref:RNA helicase n=1 Tax=Rubroshorea leprosula TaxID=152421 RepID=A0AAV5KS43_9ROSI|nr:hypothetical protein SLEP1_g36538 [Rubroshorea leprosula]